MKRRRLKHFTNELMFEALLGLIKRYGDNIVEEDGPGLRRLVEQNIAEKDVEINYFWAAEILKEFRYRLLRWQHKLAANGGIEL
jgi:hypothetical protein